MGAQLTSISVVSPVPLPAGGILLLSGLLAAAGFGYRKKRDA
ncbi:VPLPA-CTERM sorting domain-containing protein [Sulfitobacter sp. JBTF-M27]|uniref:VPLPA-CTERM sorting domain-containing protein n=1 Tax=Sulfitobacter sediminilitoris TaxID=2698830 RepID=A0A6P0CAH0_9RHOB|nr:VPLPA-CTERM sorting domain-containing protein [Sulfitobacter sediminilitoris]